jgi:small subunit ribosomal protein S2
VAVVTMKQLLEAGVHFGHQTRRWNPKMKRFIFGERNGIYIIDLNQTLDRVGSAYSFVRDLIADGGTILFVGTKKQTQDPVAEFAMACGMPYVNQRWLGGMLTNFQTVAGRVRKLAELEASKNAGDFAAMPKKEALMNERELEKLERNLGGIRGLQGPPDAIFVIDTKKEHIAVTEARKLGLPVVAVVDTNCDPDVIDYVIPGNDDAIRAGRLMCRIIADAVAEGRYIASRRAIAEQGGPRVGDSLPPVQAAAPARSAAAAAERSPGSATVEETVASPADRPAEPDTSAAAPVAGAAETAEPPAPAESPAEPAEGAAESSATATPDGASATVEGAATQAAEPATVSVGGDAGPAEAAAAPAAEAPAAEENATNEGTIDG